MGHQVLQVHLDNLEYLVVLVLMDNQDHHYLAGMDNLDKLDHLGGLVLMDNREPQENLGVLVLMGSKKLLYSRDLLVCLVRLVRQAHLANNINDVLTVQVCLTPSYVLFVLLCEPIENNLFHIFFHFAQ